MRFRAIGTRTREQIGAEFDAPDWAAAKLIGLSLETTDNRVAVVSVTQEAPLPEGSTPTEAADEDKEVEVPEELKFPLSSVEHLLESWLAANLVLLGGYRLVPHVQRGIKETLVGEWPVTFTLVHNPSRSVPGNGSLPGVPKGNSKEHAGS